MTGIIIGLFTFALVVDCLVLILLVIVQLPKKDAGAGMAFGGGAADALFGAGSGTVLTKITKYAAGIMFALALIISMMQNHGANKSNLQQLIDSSRSAAPVTQSAPPAGAPAPATPAAVTTSGTNLLLSVPATTPSAPVEK